MSQERFERLAELFAETCALPRRERAAFLDAQCGNDAALRSELEALLVEDERMVESSVIYEIEQGIADEAVSALAVRSVAPETIGPYRILGRLGEGGMGVVYRAEQLNPRRTIALKVIHSGLLSPAALRRFEFETEVLGRLHHPGIAQIHEAGVSTRADGSAELPYFAMELIEGRPLIEHADAEQLDVSERLELLGRVCDAIHHAHQKGVIHRDLKPSNILVTAGGSRPGEPKVLDFGVARATESDEKDPRTRTSAGQLIGTLPYMSPEQVSGDPDALDIRCDVYALGVVLYELLCGELPIDPKDTPVPEAARRIVEEEPMRLGRRSTRFRGDIETIVAKALEKTPDRRYASAAEFGADLRRYVRNEPISARPASRSYQLRKFVRRNRAFVAATVVVILSLVVGLVAEGIQRRKAERALAGSDRVTRFLTDLFSSASPSGSGRNVTVREKLAGVDEKLREFADQPEIESRIRLAIGETFIALGELQLAREQLERSIALSVEVHGDQAPIALHSRSHLASVLNDQGEHEASRQLADETYTGLRTQFGETDVRTLRARSIRAMALQKLGRPDTERELETVLELCREHVGPGASVTLIAMNNLAVFLRETGRFDEAEPILREILDRRIATRGDRHPDTINSQNNVGFLLVGRQRYAEALPYLETAYRLGCEVLGETHPHTRLYGNNLGVVYSGLERFAEARPFLEASVEQSRQDFGPEHRMTLISRGNLAALLRKVGEVDEAIARFPAIIAGLERALPENHPALAIFENLFGLCYRDGRRFTEAEPLLLSTFETFMDVFGPNHPRTRDAKKALAQLYDDWGKPDLADPWREPGLP